MTDFQTILLWQNSSHFIMKDFQAFYYDILPGHFAMTDYHVILLWHTSKPFYYDRMPGIVITDFQVILLWQTSRQFCYNRLQGYISMTDFKTVCHDRVPGHFMSTIMMAFCNAILPGYIAVRDYWAFLVWRFFKSFCHTRLPGHSTLTTRSFCYEGLPYHSTMGEVETILPRTCTKLFYHNKPCWYHWLPDHVDITYYQQGHVDIIMDNQNGYTTGLFRYDRLPGHITMTV